MSGERKIPKSAVKPLMEHSQKLAEETGIPALEIFKKYLELMKKYADYFFSKPWPEKPDKKLDLNDEDLEFIKKAKDYEEERERFTLVCLRRNMSIEGFDAEKFEDDFKFYGRRECWGCVVPEATGLRDYIKKVEETARMFEEKAKQENPSWIALEMCKYYKRPDVVRKDKMMLVKLRLYEELGGAEGKSCNVKNKYRCPYGEESNRLIEDGRVAKFIWRQIEWYDAHWNPSKTYSPPEQDMKWYHYDEPSIIDVTSYEDLCKAIEDGRLERIIKEHERYMKETGREEWML